VHTFLKEEYMQVKEKITLMDKILRELDDVVNSQKSVLKKIAQIEADNINLSDDLLGDSLPDIHEHVDAALTTTTELQTKFKDMHDEFVSANPVQEE
jgi:Mg2+ and Co2+ transporter CorA